MEEFKKIDKSLISNTFFLYILTFSTHFLSVITTPYLTRVLGPIVYGKIGIALAYMSYVAIIMDLGFILSATQKVVQNKNNSEYIGKLIYSISVAKLVIGVIVTIVFGIFVTRSNTMNSDSKFYMLYLMAFMINSFIPDYYYRGIEKMKTITCRTVIVKSIFVVMIFAFVKSKEDYWIVPLSLLLGNFFAVIVSFLDLNRNYKVRLYKATYGDIIMHIKDTIPFFVSRIASTVYQAMNMIILSFKYGDSNLLGHYTSADKIVSLSKSVSSPVADSLYPYMIREKNFRIIKKLLIIAMPIICVLAIIGYIYAEPICVFLFGSEFIGTGQILKCLIPIMVVILPSYILCFPVMVPLGLSKYANMSNVIGMIIQLFGLLILYLNNKLNVISLCILSSVSEVSVFAFRLLVVCVFCKKFKNRNFVVSNQNSGE